MLVIVTDGMEARRQTNDISTRPRSAESNPDPLPMINSNATPMSAPDLKSKSNDAVRGEWLVRALFVLLGLAFIFIGLEAVAHGYWWVRGYNPRLGVVGIGPTLGLVFMGAFFVFLGFIPWPRRQRKNSKSKDDLYKLP